jgi:hypothetical protein
MIPKKIHASWIDSEILTSDHVFPRHTIQKLIELSPDWKVCLNTNQDIDEYLFNTLDRSDYLLLKDRHIVEKSDVWRLMKLYSEGGLYVDIDRLCNLSPSSILKEETRCLLPTCNDDNFSQDIMCSEPGNPIYLTVLQMNLQRRWNGSDNVYFLGPQTYMHGVTLALCGEIIDVNPGVEIFDQLRKMMSDSGFVQTYRETSVYDTILYQSNTDHPFDHESMKRDYYAQNKIKHWTNDW